MFLLARGDSDFFAAGHGLRQAQRPPAFARHRFAGVVDDDDLLLDRFASEEVVVFAGEPRRLATDVSEQRLIVSQ